MSSGRSARDLHHAAMSAADDGDRALRAGDHSGARVEFRRALELEVEAIAAMQTHAEPTWSVLHRSAASLALQAGLRADAERLVATALAGDPPPEIAAELRELIVAPPS